MQSLDEGTHMQTPVIHKLGFNQNYYTFAVALLLKIVMCCKFPWTKIINHKFFGMSTGPAKQLGPSNSVRFKFVPILSKIDVEGRSICAGYPALKLIMVKPDLVRQS